MAFRLLSAAVPNSSLSLTVLFFLFFHCGTGIVRGMCSLKSR